MRTIIPLISILILLLSSCRDNPKQPEPVSRPTLETLSMELFVGETATNRITGGTEIRIMSFTHDVIDTWVESSTLHVKGLLEGKGEIRLQLDGHTTVCNVEVKLRDDPFRPEPETEQEKARKIADTSMRVDFGDISLAYSTPGTLFSMSTDTKTLTINSLITGASISFTSSHSLSFTAKPLNKADTITDGTLSLNGNTVELSHTEIYHYTANAIHVRAVPRHSPPCWIVVNPF